METISAAIILELFLIAVSMSMDAFAVSICKGLSVRKVTAKQSFCVGAWFGGFQGLMPIIGFFLATLFADAISSVSHWVAFALMALIGGNMIRESLGKDEETLNDAFDCKTMLPLAVATSVDALAMGVSLQMQAYPIWIAAAMIAATTFVLSPIGLRVGNVFGAKYKNRAEFVGGLVLVALGVKALVEGLM